MLSINCYNAFFSSEELRRMGKNYKYTKVRCLNKTEGGHFSWLWRKDVIS